MVGLVTPLHDRRDNARNNSDLGQYFFELKGMSSLATDSELQCAMVIAIIMIKTSTDTNDTKPARRAPQFSRPFTGFSSSTSVGKIQHGVIPNRETHHVRTA
jgi:hypothetical protein